MISLGCGFSWSKIIKARDIWGTSMMPRDIKVSSNIMKKVSPDIDRTYVDIKAGLEGHPAYGLGKDSIFEMIREARILDERRSKSMETRSSAAVTAFSQVCPETETCARCADPDYFVCTTDYRKGPYIN